MSYTLTWNGTSMPKAEIDGISIDGLVFGSVHRTPDGTERVSVTGEASVIKIQWRKRTSDERATLKALYYSLYDEDAKALVLPTGDTFYVLAARDGYKERAVHMGASAIRYDMSITFEEQ